MSNYKTLFQIFQIKKSEQEKIDEASVFFHLFFLPMYVFFYSLIIVVFFGNKHTFSYIVKSYITYYILYIFLLYNLLLSVTEDCKNITDKIIFKEVLRVMIGPTVAVLVGLFLIYNIYKYYPNSSKLYPWSISIILIFILSIYHPQVIATTTVIPEDNCKEETKNPTPTPTV